MLSKDGTIYQGDFFLTNIGDRYIFSLFHDKLLDQQKSHKLMVSWYAHEESQEVVGCFHDKHIRKHCVVSKVLMCLGCQSQNVDNPILTEGCFSRNKKKPFSELTCNKWFNWIFHHLDPLC